MFMDAARIKFTGREFFWCRGFFHGGKTSLTPLVAAAAYVDAVAATPH